MEHWWREGVKCVLSPSSLSVFNCYSYPSHVFCSWCIMLKTALLLGSSLSSLPCTYITSLWQTSFLPVDVPGEEKSAHSQEYDYEDDFQQSRWTTWQTIIILVSLSFLLKMFFLHLSSHSLTEEIEEQLSSYHSNSSKVNNTFDLVRGI